MKQTASRSVALTGMLLAVALVLSFFESALAGMMALPPGVKPGLSNVVVLFALLLMGRRQALALAVLKAFFALLTRGAVAGLLSLCGGLCSIAVMALLAGSRRLRVSPWTLSVAGSVAHNMGQLAAAAVVVRNGYLFYYLPVLLFSGVAAGLLTGTVYRASRPYFLRSLCLREGSPPEKRD